MINLTPHAITIFCGGAGIIIPPSGKVARVETAEKDAAPCHIEGHDVAAVTRVLGEVTGLPEDGTPCIVSSMVLAAVPGRSQGHDGRITYQRGDLDMIKVVYKIQHSIRNNWETIPDGEFETEAAAFDAIAELEEELGCRTLRIVADYCNDEDRFGWSPLRVIAYYGNDTSTEAAMCGLEGSK